MSWAFGWVLGEITSEVELRDVVRRPVWRELCYLCDFSVNLELFKNKKIR